MHINLNAMGTRMKRRRKELKMSQAELAEKVNVSNNHISSIETGKQIPSLTTFVKPYSVKLTIVLHPVFSAIIPAGN